MIVGRNVDYIVYPHNEYWGAPSLSEIKWVFQNDQYTEIVNNLTTTKTNKQRYIRAILANNNNNAKGEEKAMRKLIVSYVSFVRLAIITYT